MTAPVSTANLPEYTKHRCNNGGSGYPLTRVLALVACGTRTINDAVVGAKRGEAAGAGGAHDLGGRRVFAEVLGHESQEDVLGERRRGQSVDLGEFGRAAGQGAGPVERDLGRGASCSMTTADFTCTLWRPTLAIAASTAGEDLCRGGDQSAHRSKDLVGMPWRVVFSLQERGWVLRNAVVWEKPNARPESVRDRLAQRHEMVFLLVRSRAQRFSLRHDGVTDAWRAPAGRAGVGHPAVGTLEIARRCVRLGCPLGGVVLDPFCGSGTTGLAAVEQGCSFVGVDLDPVCRDLAYRRLVEVVEVS